MNPQLPQGATLVNPSSTGSLTQPKLPIGATLVNTQSKLPAGATLIQPLPPAEKVAPAAIVPAIRVGNASIQGAKSALASLPASSANPLDWLNAAKTSIENGWNDTTAKINKVFDDFKNDTLSTPASTRLGYVGDVGEAAMSVVSLIPSTFINGLTSMAAAMPAASVPSLAAHAFTAVLGAINGGAKQEALDAWNNIPDSIVSPEKKAALAPAIGDGADFVAQVLLFKGGSDAVGAFKESSRLNTLQTGLSHVLDTMKESVTPTIEDAPKAPPTSSVPVAPSTQSTSEAPTPAVETSKPVETTTPAETTPNAQTTPTEVKVPQGFSSELKPLAQEAIKYPTADAFVNASKTMSMSDLGVNNATVQQEIYGGGNLTEAQVTQKLTDFYNQVKQTNIEAKPSTGMVNVRTAKSAADLSQTAAEKGFAALSEEEQAKYSTSEKASVLQKVDEIVKNQADARARIRGEVPTDSNMRQPLWNAMDKIAMEEKDPVKRGEMINELAKSPIAGKRSLVAQELGSAGFNQNEHSAADLVRKVSEMKKADYEKRSGQEVEKVKKATIAKEKKSLDTSIKSSIRPRQTWEEFTKDLLTCKT